MKLNRQQLRRLIESVLLTEGDIDESTFDVAKIEKLADQIFDDLSDFSDITKKIQFTDGSGGGAAKYFGKYEAATKLLDSKSKYTEKADQLFHHIKKITVVTTKDVEKIKFMANNLLKMFTASPAPGHSSSGFLRLQGNTPDKMFDFTVRSVQYGITKEELNKARELLKNSIKNLKEILKVCKGAAEYEPNLGQSDIDPDAGQGEEKEPEKKKNGGWSSQPPEMKQKWQELVKIDKDIANKFGSKGSFREWQRWYMTSTKDKEAWEVLGKPKRKYLNKKETLDLLDILIKSNKGTLEERLIRKWFNIL